MEADIILLLISSDFLASDYCYKNEMQKALEMHSENKASVIPIILRPCGWDKSPFKILKALPLDGKPIIKYPIPDDAYSEIEREIAQIAAIRGAEKQPRIPAREKANVQNKIKFEGVHDNIRSSNLRIKQEFTDKDKDDYLFQAFEYMEKYFEGSLKELEKRNGDIEGTFQRIDNHRFTASVYRNGKMENGCYIYLKKGRNNNGGIYYSSDDSGQSYNNVLSVENDDYSLFLKSLGYFPFSNSDQNGLRSFEGGAELFWSMFIEPLQH